MKKFSTYTIKQLYNDIIIFYNYHLKIYRHLIISVENNMYFYDNNLKYKTSLDIKIIKKIILILLMYLIKCTLKITY